MLARRVLADAQVRATLSKLNTDLAELIAVVVAAIEHEWTQQQDLIIPPSSNDDRPDGQAG